MLPPPFGDEVARPHGCSGSAACKATWYMYEVSAQRAASVGGAGGPVEGTRWRGRQTARRQPVVVGGKSTRAHHPAAALRPRRVCYGSYIDARCGRASAVTPRPRPPRRRALFRRHARSLNVHGRPYAQVPILQPNVCNSVVNVAHVSIHAPMSSPVSLPPAHCRSRRRSRAAEPASPARGGGGGGD